MRKYNKGENDNIKKEREKEHFLIERKNEIETLEKQLKYIKFTNLKKSAIKNFKISLKALQLVGPYVLMCGSMVLVSKLIGIGFPFYNQDILKKSADVIKEFDNLGNVRYEEEYTFYNDKTEPTDKLRYYTKWESNDDGTYSRYMETYNAKKLETEEDFKKIFNKENIDFVELFGKPITRIQETKNNLTEEELNYENYMQAVLYDYATDDYIYSVESAKENVFSTGIYIIACVFGGFAVYFLRNKFSTFDFYLSVDDIKESYPPIDKQVLTKKLSIRKDNYDRLIRGKHE